MYEFEPPDKRRPVLVLTRNSVIPFLREVTVAPITSEIRGLASEVVLGPDEGFKRTCAANLDHVQTVPKLRLQSWVGRLRPDAMRRVCGALAAATGCDD